MSWWFTQATRARRERVVIADLQESADWLHEVKWTLSENLSLSVNFKITVGSTDVPLKITYPAYFPDLPPQVYPIGEVRLSRHQYGPGGELCLEIRTDNWEPEMDGALMIESAYRLLSGEKNEADERMEVLDAHKTTIAQNVRGNILRLLVCDETLLCLKTLPERSVTEIEFEEIHHANNWVARPSRIGNVDDPLWSKSLKPLNMSTRIGYSIRLTSGFDLFTPLDALFEFAKSINDDTFTEFINNSSIERFVLFVTEDNMLLLSLLPKKEFNDAFRYKTIILPPISQRQDVEYEALREKSVAIVGCGSVGSKVAASLARAGVGKFVLVDGDMLFPGNIVRNDLDQRSIGLNKPDAVKARIQEISTFADVSVRRTLMGGQESSASTEAALQNIAQCEVIIDATADATIFNLCAAVSKNKRIPMVWGEVFAGGVGGIVARARPDIDPFPLNARRQLVAWCADQGVPWDGKESEAYDVSRDNAPPLVADDSEVTIIAAHITRLATDILIREETIFPASAYAIGMRSEWIFSEPFETFPIKLEPNGEWQQQANEESSVELATLIEELFPDGLKGKDEG